jgi:hypothetical protein
MVTSLMQALWEMPVFVKAGTMLALAPPATSDTAMGNAIRSAPGLSSGFRGAPAVPGLAEVHWEVYHGWQQQGAGSVFDDASGAWVNASYKMEDAYTAMNISLSLPALPVAVPAKKPSSLLAAISPATIQQFEIMIANKAASIQTSDGLRVVSR